MKNISSHEFSNIQKTALDSIAIVTEASTSGKITYANKNFMEISKYSLDELIGQDHRIINSGFHPKEFIAEMWKTILSGQVWQGEIKNRAKDGSFYWVFGTITPIFDINGKIKKFIDRSTSKHIGIKICFR